MKFKVNVTEKHIKNGIACEKGSCPIALAILDMFPMSINIVEVTAGYIYLTILDGSVGYHGCVPLVAHKFIKDFDNSLKVKPFSFELDMKFYSNV